VVKSLFELDLEVAILLKETLVEDITHK